MKLRTSISIPILALLILLLLGSAVQPTAAQSNPVTLDSVLVDVWPEYDQPSVLVLVHASLAADVSLPASLSMRIPAAAGKPFALAMQDSTGLYDLNYTLAAAGDWIEVQFTTPSPDVRLEYYDPSLLKVDAQRTFTFGWPADYTTQSLTVKFQQPIDAQNMTFRPDIGAGSMGTDGLTYYTWGGEKVAAGEDFAITVSYANPSGALTNAQQFQEAEPSAPVDNTTPGRVTIFQGVSLTPLQIGMLVAGILLITVGLLYYIFTSLRAKAAAEGALGRKRHFRSTAGAAAAESDAPREPVFCHKCGKKSAAGDAFCRSCGARLRS